ncbi:DUF485 domain-containing protein [Stutzerimonas nitrititolerans]|uniref:DUF485 domain-containing protein n=1 Tax=Stutzerimonas nitrititolerans TaxID=2482751 RepID=UPI0028972327|nr:DUF485 domain-containing protein [Stutzerimonas nitrititolerans]
MTAKLVISKHEAAIPERYEQVSGSQCRSAHFQDLMRAKKRTIGPLLIATLGFFTVMTLLAGYAKDFMTIKLFGSMNVGFSLIVLAYVICWAGALLYVRAASGPFDAKTSRIIEEHDKQRT